MESCWPENLPSDRRKAIDELVKGREFANRLKAFLCDSTGDDGSMTAEDLVVKILNTFTSSLSILNRVETDAVSQFPASTQVGSPFWDGRKSEDSEESSRSTSTRKDRRGCYKRRRTSQSWVRESSVLVDDGHAWRKYGQKVILNAKHPRNYFRCTHKFDQGCQATKQVQRIEDEPPMYRTTYYGHHTCKKLVKPCHLFLDASDDADATESSMLLSFNGSGNGNGNGNGNSHLHHDHPTNKQDTPIFSSFQSIKQEYNQSFQSIKQEYNHELPRNDDHHLTHKQSSSSDYLVTLEDTFDPADVISGVNSSCSTSTTTAHHSLDIDMIHNHFDDDDGFVYCFD